MPRVSAAFFATGAIFLLYGIGMGMWMGAHQDFRIAPAHAHANLVGWVTMALYGTFYALTAKTIIEPLAWLNYGLSTIGTIIHVPMLAALILTGNNAYILPLSIGEGIGGLSLLVFLISALREVLRRREGLEAA